LEGNPEGDDRFGRVLATGDFNGDDFADLAVGVPGEDTGLFLGADAGAVNVVYGSQAGLSAFGNQIWTQDSEDIPEDNDRDDEFGAALAAGNFDGEGPDDLAIGIPSEDFGLLIGPNTAAARTDRGRIVVLYGTASGLSASAAQLWDENAFHVPDAHERFGQVLTAADFNADGFADLAVGKPAQSIVVILLGSNDGLTAAGAKFWLQDTESIPGEDDDGDRFGSALAVADAGRRVDGLRFPDLAIFVNDGTFGAANVLYGSPDGLQAEGSQLFECGSNGVAGVSQLITSPSAFDVIVDGKFTDTPGAGEWSDITAGAFITDPSDPGGVLSPTEPDSTLATSLFFITTITASAATSTSSTATSDLYMMFASAGRTNPVFPPGAAVADISFPMVIDSTGDKWRPATLQIRAGTGGSASPFIAFVDVDGDGTPDAAATDLGIAVAAAFAPSPLSSDHHLLIELKVPLFIPAGFANAIGSLPPGGSLGICSPSRAFWTVALARDDQPGLTPTAAAMLHIDPAGQVVINTDVAPHTSVGVDITPRITSNEIDLSGQGTVEVAILTTPRFDAALLPWQTVEWRNPKDFARFTLPSRKRLRDVDGDGDADLVLLYRRSDLRKSGVADTSTTEAVFVERSGAMVIAGTARVKILMQASVE
jgi:hypothetical protein